ncbi:MAG: hypothetical protein ACPKQO_00600 [Nitrososphaeraceae archaeon]
MNSENLDFHDYYVLSAKSGYSQEIQNENDVFSIDDMQKVANNKVTAKQAKVLCGSSFAKHNYFVTEYVIPFFCSQPVGITVNDKDGKIWIASTWNGYLIVFDPKIGFFSDYIKIPNWKTKNEFGSMVWGMDFDKNGDLWFTDQINNAIWRYFVNTSKFEMYKIPTQGSYPVSVSFDSTNRVWFSEIFGKKLGLIDPSKTVNGTSSGIKEYPFEDKIKDDFTTMGPAIVASKKEVQKNNESYKHQIDRDHEKEIVWFTVVDYPRGGSVIGFDLENENFHVYELPEKSGVPVGVVQDDDGNLWINDHATNLFFMLEPDSGNIKQYSTSIPNTRNTTTLPYYNEYKDGKIWFNEHEGNAIAYFDIKNNTLVEYHIPTKNTVWGNTSNPLKFAIDNNGSIWFTEWTENKIGFLDYKKISNLPISLSLSKEEIVLDKKINLLKDTIQIYVNKNIEQENKVNDSTTNFYNQFESDKYIEMIISSTISKTGRLWNMTHNFEKNNIFMYEIPDDGPLKINLELIADKNIVPGNYTLTISARYDNIVTYSKIIDLIVK